MKEGWTYKKLGEVGSFIRGGGFLKRDFVENGIPCIHYGQIHTILGSVTKEHLTSIPETLRTKTRFASKGDVIFAITSEDVEGSCKCTAWMGDYDVAVGGHAAIYKHTLNPAYVSLFAKSPVFNKAKEEFVHGFKVMEIKPADIAKIEIPVPPLSEQQRIVSRLDAAFSHIDELKANAEKQLTEARALFQKSLAKAMKPKEGWKEKKLIEITHEKCPISYGIVQQGNHIDGGVPVVRPVDMREKYITRENLKCTTQTISDSYKRTILRGDELLLSVRGTTGIISLATPELKGCNVNRGIVPLYFKDQFNKDFLYYEMVSPILQSVFAEKTTGSTLKQINIKDLRLIKLSIPPNSEQQRIVERLDALSAHVRKLEENQKKIISECDALKQALLRKVFE